MNGAVHDLVGAWRLERWSLEYEDGRTSEFPLGPDARGMLLYTPGGHVSATLMNTGQPSASLGRSHKIVWRRLS